MASKKQRTSNESGNGVAQIDVPAVAAPEVVAPARETAGTARRPRTDTNLVVLTGRLGDTPELRYLASGASVAQFPLAVSRIAGSGDERREQTSWVQVKCWNRLAEVCAEHLQSGRRVLIEGRLEEERWQDRETGQNRSRMVVVAERIEFLDGPRPESDNDADEEAGAVPA